MNVYDPNVKLCRFDSGQPERAVAQADPGGGRTVEHGTVTSQQWVGSSAPAHVPLMVAA